MNYVTLLLIAIAITCLLIGFFMLRFALQGIWPKRTKVEKRIKSNTPHDVPIYDKHGLMEDTGSLLNIPTPIRRSQPSLDWDDM